MALATLHLAAIPVVAGLLAGSGALAAFIAAPSSPAAMVGVAPSDLTTISAPAPQAGLPCTAQAWPYIDQNCMTSANNAKRTVRLVMAPRTGEAIETSTATVSSTTSAATARAAEPSLTTSDTVLRQPQQLAAKDPEPQVSKPRAKRRGDTRRQRDRRWAVQSYQVPSESQGRRPVIVVRPLRLETFR